MDEIVIIKVNNGFLVYDNTKFISGTMRVNKSESYIAVDVDHLKNVLEAIFEEESARNVAT